MRKWNAILGALILILFLIHAVAGGFQLYGVLPGGNAVLEKLSRALAAVLVIHVFIGAKLTWDSFRAGRKAGVSYLRENRLFWARRISGFAILLFLADHILLFVGKNKGPYRLELFEGPQLASSILLVAAIAVHVLTNLTPLLISLGIRGKRRFASDVLAVLSVLLLFAGAAFLVYYLRWNF